MSDIFISYAREDLEAARRLAGVLEGQGWSVFWDRTIPAGKTWREVIGAALSDARCVVVLWSRHSVTSHWVLEEADHGLRRRILIPALIESVEPPLGFGSIQAADLSRWSGNYEDAAIEQFLGDVAGVLGPAPVVPAQERAKAKAEAQRKAEEQQRQQAEAEAKRKSEGERKHPNAEAKRAILQEELAEESPSSTSTRPALVPGTVRMLLTLIAMVAASLSIGLVWEQVFGFMVPTYLPAVVGGSTAVGVWEFLKRLRPRRHGPAPLP